MQTKDSQGAREGVRKCPNVCMLAMRTGVWGASCACSPARGGRAWVARAGHRDLGPLRQGGIRKGFVVIACRACADPSCARVCPVDALEVRPEGGVRLHTELCIGCHNCVGACPFGAPIWDSSHEKPAICTGCGYCVDYCPYGVLELKELAPQKEEVVYVGQ